jgi:hypothetical protein
MADPIEWAMEILKGTLMKRSLLLIKKGPMKTCYLLLLILIFPLKGFSADSSHTDSGDWNDVLTTYQDQFAVSVRPKQRKIELKKTNDDQDTPPHLRVRALRPNDRPLELRLKTIGQPGSPYLHTSELKKWNDSYVGFGVNFSFYKIIWEENWEAGSHNSSVKLS